MFADKDYLLLFLSGVLTGVGLALTGYGTYNAIQILRYRRRHGRERP